MASRERTCVAMSAPAQWRKSSHSPNEINCIELANIWLKSSYSPNEANCVEVTIMEHEALRRRTLVTKKAIS